MVAAYLKLKGSLLQLLFALIAIDDDDTPLVHVSPST